MPLLSRLTLIAAFAMATPALAEGPMSTLDEGAIVTLMMASFDRPEARLNVEPVTVSGVDAIAGWQQGDMAGRALLHRTPDGWRILLCAGEEVLDPGFLAHHGVSAQVAQSLTEGARGAESALGATLIARLDSFEGVMLIGEGETHGHGDAQAGH